MNPDVITCNFSVALPSGAAAPDWFMYAPGGVVKSQPAVNGEAVGEVEVTITAATAAALQRDLAAFMAEGGPQPFFDFDHANGPRAAMPLEFAWRDAPAPGVWVRVRWTPQGEAAVIRAPHQAPAYSHFSPRAAFDKKTGRITGLLPRAAGLAAGGLVNDPGFSTISPLTAGKAAAHAAPDNKNKNNTMTKEMQALVAAGVLTAEEAATDTAAATLTARLAELKAAKPAASPDNSAAVAELTARLNTTTAELTAMKGRAADAFVAGLQRDGKIPPQAAATAALWKKNWLLDPAGTESAATELVAAKALGATLTTEESAAQTAAGRGDIIAAKAQALQAANSALSWDAAWKAAAAEVNAANQ